MQGMFDLHIHTIYSIDGREEPEDMAKFLRKMGFGGMAIVDHNTMKGAFKVKMKDFVVIPGMEIKTHEGHILALGIGEEIRSKNGEEVVEEIREKGGISILAHPFRFSRPRIKTDAIEALNGRNFPLQNRRGMEYAKKNKIPVTGGSDAHFLWEAGRAYTIMNAECVDDALDEILRGETDVGGEETFWHPIKCKIYSLHSFVKRGFKRVE